MNFLQDHRHRRAAAGFVNLNPNVIRKVNQRNIKSETLVRDGEKEWPRSHLEQLLCFVSPNRHPEGGNHPQNVELRKQL